MSPLVKIHVVCERRICRKQTVRRWIRQKTSLSASLLLSSLCSGSKIQAFAGPILGVIRVSSEVCGQKV